MTGFVFPEVSSWQYLRGEAIDFEDLGSGSLVGVFIKTSQGRNWVAPYAASVARQATRAGLLLGAVHTADLNDAEPADQAAIALGSLPPHPYPLGVVLEILDFGVVGVYGVDGWVKTFAEVASSMGLELVLDLPNSIYTDIPSAPWGYRSVMDERFAQPGATVGTYTETGPALSKGGMLARWYAFPALRGLNATIEAPTDDDEETEDAPVPPANPGSVPETPAGPEEPENEPQGPEEEVEALAGTKIGDYVPANATAE
jgi:hypothetical protein